MRPDSRPSAPSGSLRGDVSASSPAPPEGLRVTQCTIDGVAYVLMSHPIPLALPRSFDALSSAERDVVAHVLEGWTQAQIADYRKTSPRTVAKQLESAYRRLGVSSRAQLVALVEGGG